MKMEIIQIMKYGKVEMFLPTFLTSEMDEDE
jgi:hypothetical protein